MLKAITVTNFKGESLRMELSRPENSGLLVYNVTGIGSPTSYINVTEQATIDGGRFNSARAQSRNIVLTLAMVERKITGGGSSGNTGGGSSSGGVSSGVTSEELRNLETRVTNLENSLPSPMSINVLNDIIKGDG